MKHEGIGLSSSKVILMCGPAGNGKSTFAKRFEQTGMTILSSDQESIDRGYNVHLLPPEVQQEVTHVLDGKLISLIKQNKDVFLDYSFWSKQSRMEYVSFLRTFGIEPVIYYINTPKTVAMERIRRRKGSHANDIILPEETASLYYDHFQPPSDDEGQVIVVEEV